MMHLYKYYQIPGDLIYYFKYLCQEKLNWNGDEVWYCKKYLKKLRVYDLKLSCNLDEIPSMGEDYVRFGVKFAELNLGDEYKKAIASMIFIDWRLLEEKESFDDFDKFISYPNNDPDYDVVDIISNKQKKEEEEECIR